MKQNVLLFSIVAAAALYLYYGTEKKHTVLEEVPIKSISDPPHGSEIGINPTRKLLSYADTQKKLQKVDTAGISVGNVLDNGNNAQLDLVGKEATQNFGLRKHKYIRRRKRSANNPEQFAWNFNLNVTRYENDETSNNLVAYPTPGNKKQGKSDDRYLGMAMSVSGNGQEQSVEDLHQAWDSVGKFLRSLFGGNLEELREKGHGVSIDVSSLPNGSIELPHELFLEGSGEEDSQELRNRKGKFLLGIFGFGGNKENPPRDEGSGDVLDIHEFDSTESDIQFANGTIERTEFLSTLETLSIGEISTVPTLFMTENINLKESVTSSLGLDQTSFTTSNPIVSNKLASISSILEDPPVENCSNCELQTEPFALTDDKIPSEENPTPHTLVSNSMATHFPLSDESLKDFCIALFSKMRTTGRSVEQFENFEGSGSFEIDETNISNASDVNTHATKLLTDKPRSQSMGFFESIWKRIVGRKVVPSTDETLNGSRGARFINLGNLFIGFGSGRSAGDLGETSNIEFDNLDVNLTGNIDDREQFLLDCEEFLRSVQTETRPNIFDLVNPHPIDSSTTEFTTQNSENSQLEEQERENSIKEIISNFESTTQKEVFTIISSISKPDNVVKDQTLSNWPVSQLSTEMPDKQFEENEGKKHFTETTQLDDLVFTEVQGTVQGDLFSVQNLSVEKHKEMRDFPATETSDISILTNVTQIDVTIKETNENNLNEDASINIFEFGSGDEEGSSDISIAERFLGGLINFGSGDREIKETEISTEDSLAKTTENFKERSFGEVFDFGSGEREIKEMNIFTEQSSEKTTLTSKGRSFSFNNDFSSGARELEILNNSKFINNEDTITSTIANQGRIFGLGFGSGEREISETAEVTAEKNETELLQFFPSTEEFSMTTQKSFITSLFPVKISEKSISPDTNVPFVESEINTETSDERTFGQNISKSGDSRDLSNEIINTEDISCLSCLKEQNTTECGGCERIINDNENFTNLDPSTIKNFAVDEILSENKMCPDCEVKNLPTMQEDSFTPASFLNKMLSTTDVITKYEVKTNKNELEIARNIVQPSFSTKREDPSVDVTEITLQSTTEGNKSRFLGTIFLTGSGDSGLFVDNKGPINLVEESEFTSPVFQQSIQSGRGARKHDPELQKPKERNFEPTIPPFQITSESKSITLETLTDASTLDTSVTEAFNETEDNSEASTLDTSVTEDFNETEDNSVFLEIIDEIVTSVASTPTVQPEFSEVTVTSIPKLKSTNIPESFTTTVVVASTLLNVKPRSKVTEPPQRFCTSASQCNRTLNERCIFDGPIALCTCGRSYVRSPETGKCESPVVLKTSLKLPGEVFHQDLQNRNSERFKKMANDSIETMWLLLGDDPDLFRLVAGVSVSGFEEGSLVVHWEITLAAPPNESVAHLIQQLDDELNEAFGDEALLRKVPLNVHDAVLMEVTDGINQCKKMELNYCSKNADCIRDPMRGFKCLCKDDYVDQSTDTDHTGEICIAICPPYYCGDHGECNLKQNGDRHCSCNSWYFGEKCAISGIVVIAGFSSFNVLLIIIVLFLVCYCRKRRYRQSKFYGQNQVRFQPEAELGRFRASPRLADTIALSEVGPTKASRYMAISTPMHNTPDIRLTSPSILGSSVDYDSTFDRTPSVEEIHVEVHESGTTPKV